MISVDLRDPHYFTVREETALSSPSFPYLFNDEDHDKDPEKERCQSACLEPCVQEMRAGNIRCIRDLKSHKEVHTDGDDQNCRNDIFAESEYEPVQERGPADFGLEESRGRNQVKASARIAATR